MTDEERMDLDEQVREERREEFRRWLLEDDDIEENLYDDFGIHIEKGDFFVKTDQCTLASSSIKKVAESHDLAGFLTYVYGIETEIPEWTKEYFEDGDYSGILFEMGGYDCYKSF